MDALDAQVVRRLRRDVRAPYDQIGEDLGLGADEVEARVDRMVRDGEIILAAVTDPVTLGFSREALLGITVEPGRRADVVAALAAMPEVHYLVSVTGGFDVLAEVAGASDALLLEILSQRITPVPGIAHIHTFLYLSTEKMSFDYELTRPEPERLPTSSGAS